MLAGIRDVTPVRRLGTTIAIFGASGPIGFAVGPALAGILDRRPRLVAAGGVLAVGRAVRRDGAARRVRLARGPARGRPDRSRRSTSPSARSAASSPIRVVRRIFADLRRVVPRHPDDAGRTSRCSSRDSPARARAWPRRSRSSWARRRSSAASISPLGGVLGDRIGFRLGARRRARRRRRRAARDAVRRRASPRWPVLAVVSGAATATGQRDGLRPARDRGPAGAAVGDAEPRLPAALRGGHRRAGRRRRRRRRSRA